LTNRENNNIAMTSKVTFQKYTPNPTGVIQPADLDKDIKYEEIDGDVRNNKQFVRICKSFSLNPLTVMYLAEKDDEGKYRIRLLEDTSAPGGKYPPRSEQAILGHKF